MVKNKKGSRQRRMEMTVLIYDALTENWENDNLHKLLYEK